MLFSTNIHRSVLCSFYGALSALILLPQAATANDPKHKSEAAHANKHALSLFIGNSDVVDEDVEGFTLGLDYEYELTEKVGAGFVAEYAFGELDAAAIFAVLDIHLYKGLVIQVGPGLEIADEHEEEGGLHGMEPSATSTETSLVGRLGVLYEIEVSENMFIAPQIHFDTGPEDVLVYGIGIGRKF